MESLDTGRVGGVTSSATTKKEREGDGPVEIEFSCTVVHNGLGKNAVFCMC